MGLTVDHHGAARTVTGYDTDADGTVHVALDDDEHAPLDDVAVTDADHDTFAARVHAHPTA